MDVHVTQLDVGNIKPLWLQDRAEIDIIVPPDARVIVPITVLHLHGALDGSSYETLVEAARAEIEGGARRMIIDLTGVDAVTTAGVIGLYTVGTLLEGGSLDDLEGYAVMDEMRKAIDRSDTFVGLYLAAPNEKVAHALSATSIDQLARTLPSVEEAISAFPDE